MLQCVERSILPNTKISSTTYVQWLHGKQEQGVFFLEELPLFFRIGEEGTRQTSSPEKVNQIYRQQGIFLARVFHIWVSLF